MTKLINPDQRLIDGIAVGDPKILNEIYTNYSKAILHLVETNNGTADDAQDVFQEGMMVLFRKARATNFQLTSNFLTYFYSVCRHIWWKKRDKKGRNTTNLDEVQEIPDSASIEQDIFRKERYKLYLQKLQLLGESCRKVLTLFHQGKSMKEIMAIMGFGSVGYTKKRKFKCKEKLVELVRGDGVYRELREV